MKQTLLISLLAMIVSTGSLAQAAQVEDARINFNDQTIEIDVAYSGGCEQHEFDVQIRSCTRSTPMTCVVEVIDTTKTDLCRQIVQETVVVPAADYLAKAPLADIVIVGANNSAVRLPLR